MTQYLSLNVLRKAWEADKTQYMMFTVKELQYYIEAIKRINVVTYHVDNWNELVADLEQTLEIVRLNDFKFINKHLEKYGN